MSLPVRRPADEQAPIIRQDGPYTLALTPRPVLQENGTLVPLGVQLVQGSCQHGSMSGSRSRSTGPSTAGACAMRAMARTASWCGGSMPGGRRSSTPRSRRASVRRRVTPGRCAASSASVIPARTTVASGRRQTLPARRRLFPYPIAMTCEKIVIEALQKGS